MHRLTIRLEQIWDRWTSGTFEEDVDVLHFASHWEYVVSYAALSLIREGALPPFGPPERGWTWYHPYDRSGYEALLKKYGNMEPWNMIETLGTGELDGEEDQNSLVEDLIPGVSCYALTSCGLNLRCLVGSRARAGGILPHLRLRRWVLCISRREKPSCSAFAHSAQNLPLPHSAR